MFEKETKEPKFFEVRVKVEKRHFEKIGTQNLNDAIAKGLELYLQSEDVQKKSDDVFATLDSMMGLARRQISRVGDHTCSKCGQLLVFTPDKTRIQLEQPDRKAKKTKSHAYTIALTLSCNCGHSEQIIAESTFYIPKKL